MALVNNNFHNVVTDAQNMFQGKSITEYAAEAHGYAYPCRVLDAQGKVIKVITHADHVKKNQQDEEANNVLCVDKLFAQSIPVELRQACATKTCRNIFRRAKGYRKFCGPCQKKQNAIRCAKHRMRRMTKSGGKDA